MDISTLHQAFLSSTGICTDTRKVEAGKLFLALKGPNFNANKFAAQALEGGCSFAVVDEVEFVVEADDRYILVDDGLRALQTLANYHRKQFPELTVLGITGTNGKTTTKELIHAVLDSSHEVLATKGNLNNHIGVPLTLLELNDSHRIAVIEMGANKPGDIKELCDIAEPDLGLITNIGQAHLEGFGGFEGVLKTKTELYEHIRSRAGSIFLNAADPVLCKAASGIAQQTYGIGAGEVNGKRTSSDQFLAFTWNNSSQITTKLFGEHNLINALAAICIGQHFGTDADKMANALASYAPSNNRSQWQQTAKNSLIMDAYNANPTSVNAAVESLANLKSDQEKLVILGDMFEMGDSSEEAHLSVVNGLIEKSLNAILIGPDYKKAAQGFLAFESTAAAIQHIKANPITNKCILVKGSRGMKLEELYELL